MSRTGMTIHIHTGYRIQFKAVLGKYFRYWRGKIKKKLLDIYPVCRRSCSKTDVERRQNTMKFELKYKSFHKKWIKNVVRQIASLSMNQCGIRITFADRIATISWTIINQQMSR